MNGNLWEAREGKGHRLGAVALFRGNEPPLGQWLTGRDGGTIMCPCVWPDGPEFVDKGRSGGKGAGCTDSRRRSDV